jgi:16S rRNA (uracil1498-N3)-methyltransferase
MHLFYTPDITSGVYTLSEEESKHCTRVLRLSEGDAVHLIDGRGGFYTAIISEAHPKRCTVSVTEKKEEYGKRDYRLHIAIAPTKMNERMEWFLEKATEIGIDEITPLLCEHSERKELKTERMNKIITSAVKQSIKAYHPLLHEATRLSDFIRRSFEGDTFIAHCMETHKISLKNAYSPKKNALILIGPEGDFSAAEVDAALKQGFRPVSLGDSRLRTETAGVVACHTIHLLNQS